METFWNHNTGCEYFRKEGRGQLSVLTRLNAQLERGISPNQTAFGILTDRSQKVDRG